MAAVQRHFVPLPTVGTVHELQKLTPWDFDLRVLENGNSPGSVETISTGPVMLQKFRFAWKLHQRGAPPRGMRTFGIGVEPAQSFPWCGQTLEHDWLVAFPHTGGFECVSNHSFHAYAVAVDETLLEETAEALGLLSLGERVPPASVYGPERVPVADLRESLEQIFQAARQPSLKDRQAGLARAIERDLVGRLIQTLSGGHPRERTGARHRDRALKRSLDFIEQPGERPISVRELCAVSGASWRTLNYAFKERFGETPQAYLRARRLNAVRRELCNATPERGAVSRVAGRWEFWHMGDFARDYRRLFGELPSETLRGEKTGR